MAVKGSLFDTLRGQRVRYLKEYLLIINFMAAVGLKAFREHLGEYIQKVHAGEELVVMRHATPLFKVSPLTHEAWEEVIDFTQLKHGGVRVEELLSRL